MSGTLIKLIFYLKKKLKSFLMWTLTPREIILRQRDKIYSIKLSTKIQGFILSFSTIICVWIVYSSLFYVKFDELITLKNKKISELNDNLYVAKKDQEKLGQLEKEYATTISVFLESTENNSKTLTKTIAETGLDPNKLLKRSSIDIPRGGAFIPEIDETSNELIIENKLQKLEALQNIVHSIPFVTPLDYYWVSSNYGRRIDPINKKKGIHYGIDLVAQTSTIIMATASGIVTAAGKRANYGRMIEIDHGYGIKTRYGHLHKISKKKGEMVDFREEIGRLGSSGRVTGPHLHYEILYDYKPLNPAKFINAGKNLFKISKIEEGD
jgi:murein DD-endopeptidase MepM/ murein hydrolase activator NlpD